MNASKSCKQFLWNFVELFHTVVVSGTTCEIAIKFVLSFNEYVPNENFAETFVVDNMSMN